MVPPFLINLFVNGTQEFHGILFHQTVCCLTVAVIISLLRVLAILQLFAKCVTTFPLRHQVIGLPVSHQISQVLQLFALLDVQEMVNVDTLVFVTVFLVGAALLVQRQLVPATVFAMATGIV